MRKSCGCSGKQIWLNAIDDSSFNSTNSSLYLKGQKEKVMKIDASSMEWMSDLSRFVKAQETDYERGADKTSRKQRCGDCYRKI